jgi:hypothetical protein
MAASAGETFRRSLVFAEPEKDVAPTNNRAGATIGRHSFWRVFSGCSVGFVVGHSFGWMFATEGLRIPAQKSKHFLHFS